MMRLEYQHNCHNTIVPMKTKMCATDYERHKPMSNELACAAKFIGWTAEFKLERFEDHY